MNVKVAPFLDGGFTDSLGDHALPVENPSTGKWLMDIPAGAAADVDRAVISARRVFEKGSWSEASPTFKKKILHRFADLIEAQASELDLLDALEMGKPVSVGFGNGLAAAHSIRFCAEAVDKIAGDSFQSHSSSMVCERLVPRGVVAAIVPWNFPAYNAVLKVGPALAAGNSVVLKPSEIASRSALRIVELAMEAGLPSGALNAVPGHGEIVGRALGLHGDVDMLAFTGSSTVGKLMLQYSGQSNMKVVVAECGGKSPHIVFDDGVDLASAARTIGASILCNQGQICSVGSRVLVHRGAEDELLIHIQRAMAEIVMGDAALPATTFGPLASRQQRDRVLSFIDGARADGLELLAGGSTALAETGGFFVQPTLFRNVSPSARIAQEEIFGPVLSVTCFDEEDEAIRLANGTEFGLFASVWTADLARGMRMAKHVRSPVMINAASPRGDDSGHAYPIEPARQSGVGIESGFAGAQAYSRRQLVWFNHG